MMLEILHLAHDHASVRRLRQQLADRPNESHQWVMAGEKERGFVPGKWSLGHQEDLPKEVVEHRWDAIVVHRMRSPTPKWLLSLPAGPMVVWATWGDDYYRVFPALSKGIYLPATRILLGAIGKFSVSLLWALQKVRNVLIPGRWMVSFRDLELAAMGRVDGIANMFESEFIALPYLPRRPKYFYPSWYNAVPKQIPDVEASKDPNGPILLGSSAATTGNQLDFLWERQGVVRASGRSVRMVLAYGSSRYAKSLQVLGKLLLGGQVEWLRERLPLEDYYRYLSECPVVVHNQIRNQNTGNVVLSFLMGQRVLLRNDAQLFRLYSGMGFVVGDAAAEDLDLSPLSEKDRRHNRELVLRLFGDDAVNQRFDAFIGDLRRSEERNLNGGQDGY